MAHRAEPHRSNRIVGAGASALSGVKKRRKKQSRENLVVELAHYHQGKTIGKREKGKRREKGKGKTIGKREKGKRSGKGKREKGKGKRENAEAHRRLAVD